MKKRTIPFLIPPLLAGCSGFNARTPQPDTPALVFVDGQISESTDIIAQTQRRLLPPSTPVPVRQPTPTAVAPRSAPLPVPVLQTISPTVSKSQTNPATTKNSQVDNRHTSPVGLPGLTFTGTPAPVAVLALSPARNLTLEQWIRRIMPSGWQLDYENALRPVLNTRIVSVYTNDQWTRVLSRLLTEQAISGQVDWNQQKVTLRRAGQTTATGVQSTTTTIPATVKPVSTSVPKNPFSGGGATPPTTPGPDKKMGTTNPPVSPVPPVLPKPVVSTGQPVMPVITGKTWQAPAGTTLREMLLKWAGETRCESGASQYWTVIWPTSVTDYRLDAPLTFRGTFESMLGQMFELYRTAQKPLYAEASRVQCVVSVSDTPAGH